MLKSYKWDWVWVWDGMGWEGRKSLKGVILRAPLCGANNEKTKVLVFINSELYLTAHIC